MFCVANNHWQKKIKTFIALGLVTVLAGCGFALRGNIEIPLEARSIWLLSDQKSSAMLKSNFRSLAKQNGLTYDESAENKIKVTSISFRKITTTLSSDAEVDEYTLRAELSFNILDKLDQTLAKNLEGYSERTFEYDANDAAASNSREKFLEAEIWRDLSAQILRQYAAYVRLKK